MREPGYALVVGTRADLECSGHLLGGQVQLNGCCSFPIWRRGGDIAIQIVAACQTCLHAMRTIVGDPVRARELASGSDRAVSLKMVFERDASAPRTPLLLMPSSRYVAN
jgi:hypothetical protein